MLKRRSLPSRKRCRSIMGAGTPPDGSPRRQKFKALTQPTKNMRVRYSMKLDLWQNRSGYLQRFCMFPNAHPATAIIEAAKFRGCDLIVMASHGRRGLRKFLLGSQSAHMSVLDVEYGNLHQGH